MRSAPNRSHTPLWGFGLGLCLALAAPLGCVTDDKPAGAGGHRADGGVPPDTAAVGCAAQPLDCDGDDNDCDGEDNDCDGEDNDCDGVIDEGGEVEARQL